MRLASSNRGGNFEWRRQMLEETSRFIEWGLQHPDEVPRIPRHPVGRGGFSERIKVVFWTLALREKE